MAADGASTDLTAAVAAQLRQRLHAARQRRLATWLLLGLPLLAGLAALAGRAGGSIVALLVGAAALALLLGLAGRDRRRCDARWLARRLDRLRPDLDDSSALLLLPAAAPAGMLAGLQRRRLEARLQAQPAPDLRPPWPRRALLGAWLAGMAVLAAALAWPRVPLDLAASATAEQPTAAADPGATRLLEPRLQILPPAYTGLPERSEAGLEARLPAGSEVRWQLGFAPAPASASLRFHDGTRLPLQPDGSGRWQAGRTLARATLYRIELDGAALAEDRLQRLDVIPDRPPQLRVLAPQRSLTLLEPGQQGWALEFEASDDYGLGAAELQLTLAQGSGEQVSVSERVQVLDGEGSAVQRRYRTRLDLAALGFGAGDDLIVRFVASDQRAPEPQSSRSASYILRWPAPASAAAAGLDGLVQKTLPAYFRSQRQIIIDSEALLAEQPRPPEAEFERRSDSIGVDQRLLRLRYGQFLGEEAESGALPGMEAPAAVDEHDEHDGHEHGDHTPQPAPPAAHAGHDHAAEPAGPAPLDGNAVLEQYGHAHDLAEATTLLDPETRALLKAALNEMWQAELHLRQARPELALPYEYRALGYIKQVQQASRIYLARVGLELPPVDETRRLSGEREGLQDRRSGLVAAPAPAAEPAALWSALADWPAGNGMAALAVFEDWLQQHPPAVGSTESESESAQLALLAASDTLRRDPACAACLARLRTLLWPLLAPPPAAVGRRAAADAAGRAYLDALRAGAEPLP